MPTPMLTTRTRTGLVKTISETLVTTLKGVVTGGLMHLFLAVEPVPASRPRVTRWGAYYTKTYEAFRVQASRELAKFKSTSTDGHVAVAMEIVCTRPRTSKLLTPKGDVDNYVKGPLDSMTQAEKFWGDDKQVVLLAATKRFAAPGETAGIHIHWGIVP
jgi:Holliday junction resolvase RusA-like endonuclease